MSFLRAKPIGMMQMIDQGERDDKIIAVHADDPEYRHFEDISELPKHRLNEIRRFFEDYKKNENKDVKVSEERLGGWGGGEEGVFFFSLFSSVLFSAEEKKLTFFFSTRKKTSKPSKNLKTKNLSITGRRLPRRQRGPKVHPRGDRDVQRPLPAEAPALRGREGGRGRERKRQMEEEKEKREETERVLNKKRGVPIFSFFLLIFFQNHS